MAVQELSELVYLLCTKSRSVLCIPMGIHRNESAANLNLKEHQFFLTHPVYVERLYRYNRFQRELAEQKKRNSFDMSSQKQIPPFQRQRNATGQIKSN